MARGINSSYRSYRGRTPLWKKLLAVILILVIAAAAGITVVLQHLVYDDSGRGHIVLGEDAQTPELPAVDPDSLTITVEEPKADESMPAEVQATAVAAAPLTAETALPQGAVVLTMKDSAGRIYWPSTVGSAAVQTAPTTQAAIEALTGGERWAAARLSCFRDAPAARRDTEGMGLKNTGGYLFYDGNGENWLDPAKQTTREYLCALAAELADQGFREIILTDFTYPTVGKLDKIDYGGTAQSAALTECLRAIREALSGRNVTLTLELSAAAVFSGADEAAGIELAALAPLTDRIAVAAAGGQQAQLRARVQEAAASTDLLLETADVTGLSGSWVLTEE